MKEKDLFKLIGLNIRYYRLKKKMTQENLGFAIGAWQSRISELEKGRLNATVSQLNKIARALDIDIVLLFINKETNATSECVDSL